MTREANQEKQGRLAFGAAEGVAAERISTILNLIGLLDKRDLHLREFLLMIFRLETAQCGMVRTHQQLAAARELCCEYSKVRRTIDLAKSLGIISCQPQQRLDGTRGANEYRLNWPAILDVIARKTGHGFAPRTPAHSAHPSAHPAQPSAHHAQGSAHSAQPPRYRSRTRALLRPSSPFSVVDVPSPRADGDGSEIQAGRTTAPTAIAEPTAEIDLQALVRLVAGCGVERAEYAVRRALGHGVAASTIAETVEGWKHHRRGWPPDKAPLKLYYRLKDEPVAGRGPWDWQVHYPERVTSRASIDREAHKRRAERERDQALALEKAARDRAQKWIRSMAEAEQLAILEEYREQAPESIANMNRGLRSPLDDGFFLNWLAERNEAHDER